MAELNFCPSCDAPRHKLMQCKDAFFYCRECFAFFSWKPAEAKCAYCPGQLQKSDFDAPDGKAIFMCRKCKKTFPLENILEDLICP